mgnify:FL=1
MTLDETLDTLDAFDDILDAFDENRDTFDEKRLNPDFFNPNFLWGVF